MKRHYPARLHHAVPGWVEIGALFHIRVALDREVAQPPLTTQPRAKAILASAAYYEERGRWSVTLLVLMPDHLHALVAFPQNEAMSTVVADWKRFHSRSDGIVWQDGYFDHRLRDDERGEQLSLKMDYIRRNPVAAGLCARPEDWPWIYCGTGAQL